MRNIKKKGDRRKGSYHDWIPPQEEIDICLNCDLPEYAKYSCKRFTEAKQKLKAER